MKRARDYGTLRTERGDVPIKHAEVAETLRQQQEAIEHLRQRLHATQQDAIRLTREVGERNAQLARLQNHPWTIVGRALGFVREGRHDQEARSVETVAQAAAPAHGEAATACAEAGLQPQAQAPEAARQSRQRRG